MNSTLLIVGACLGVSVIVFSIAWFILLPWADRDDLDTTPQIHLRRMILFFMWMASAGLAGIIIYMATSV